MVELYGAAMVVEEMERLALGLLDGQIKQAEDAYTVLMRGMVQLPDYLERLQSGHRDIPIVLLPLLNDLRACRGEKLLSETSLFSPDLGAALPASAGGARAAVPQPMIAANGGRLRLAFQFGLLKWFKGDDVDGNLTRLVAILDRVRSMLVQIDARRLFWVAAAALEAVLVKGVEASVALKLLVGKVDRELKRLIDAGEAAFSSAPPNDLTKSLLYYVAQSKATSERIGELRQIYKLDKLMPSEAELEHARGALSGHNRALLETVGTAIKEDLLRVKDALDLYLRTGSGNVEDLAPQGEALHRVADTLGMLGLGVPRRVVLDQQDILERIVRGRQPAEESALLDIAGSLLYVESSLDDHIERLGADQRQVAPPSGGFELPQAEVRKILDATTKEASANIQQAKQDIVAFIESPWDHSKIEQIPRLLEEISGAMRMLNLPEPAALLQGVVRFAEVELLQHRRVPSGDQLDLMADAIASIEFYLEAVKEGRRNRDKILDVTRRSLEALGYWPLPEEGAEPATAVALETTAPVPAAVPTAAEFPTFADTFTTERVAPPEPAEGTVEPVAAEAPISEAGAVEALIASFSQPEPPVAEPEVLSVAPMEAEIQSAVEIAPGPGLESLVIGESAAEALVPSVQDLDGLRLSIEPEATAEPVVEAPAAAPIAEALVAEPVVETEIQAEPESPEPLFEPTLELTTTDLSVVEEAPAEVSPVAPEPVAPVVEPVAAAPVATPRVEAPAAIAMPPGIQLPDVGFHSVPSDEIDDEIREVFVEEVQDELDNLNRQYPAWKNDLGDLEKLKPVRRSFHTLKGSGRLVGALAIGEYAWKIENMLNRVLDKTIQPTPAVLDLLDHAIAALPGMLAALKGEGQPDANVGTIMWVADQLATGQEVWLPKFSPAPVDTAEAPASEAGADDIAAAAAEASFDEIAQGVDEPESVGEAGSGQADAVVDENPGLAAIEPEAVAAELAQQPDFELPVFDEQAEMLEAEVAGATTEPGEPAGSDEQPAGDATPDDASLDGAIDVEWQPAQPEALMEPATAADRSEEPVVDAAEPSPLDVDPMLMEILGSEVEAHLLTIRTYLADTAENGPFPVTEELLRAVHTLNGALSMVDLPVLTRVVAPLEGYLKRLRARGLEPSVDGVDALRESADCIAQVMHLLQARQALPDTTELAEQVLSLREGLPAPDHPFHGFGIQVADEAREESREAAAEGPSAADGRPWYEAEDDAEASVELTEVFDAGDVVASDDLATLGQAEPAGEPDVRVEPVAESLVESDLTEIDHLFAEVPEEALEPAIESVPMDTAPEAGAVAPDAEADLADETVELAHLWFEEPSGPEGAPEAAATAGTLEEFDEPIEALAAEPTSVSEPDADDFIGDLEFVQGVRSTCRTWTKTCSRSSCEEGGDILDPPTA
jgi:chemosensory pili system protein ChpA (sensor histidine kinase/response regulator)